MKIPSTLPYFLRTPQLVLVLNNNKYVCVFQNQYNNELEGEYTTGKFVLTQGTSVLGVLANTGGWARARAPPIYSFHTTSYIVVVCLRNKPPRPRLH